MKTFINTLTSSILLFLVYLSVGATGPLAIVGTALYWVYAVVLTIIVLMLPFVFMVNKEHYPSTAFSIFKIVMNVGINTVALVIFAYAGWAYPFALSLICLLAFLGICLKYYGFD